MVNFPAGVDVVLVLCSAKMFSELPDGVEFLLPTSFPVLFFLSSVNFDWKVLRLLLVWPRPRPAVSDARFPYLPTFKLDILDVTLTSLGDDPDTVIDGLSLAAEDDGGFSLVDELLSI